MSSRKAAHLSSGLLSRKGMAAPSAGSESRTNRVGALLGGPDAPLDALAAETTRPQLRQGPAPARSTMADWVAPKPAPPVGAHGQQDRMAQKRVRVSLRLDSDRHTRLKLVATQRNCTLQSLFTEAIDEFFVRHAPDLHGISAHLRRGTSTTCTATPGTATPGTATPGTASTASEGKIGLGKRNSEGRNGPSRSR